MAISLSRNDVAELDYAAFPQVQDFPAMNLYCADWLTGTSTQAMTNEQTGILITLIAQAWRQSPPCSLPDDPDVLASYARRGSRRRWEKVGAIVRAQFIKCASDGRLRNAKQVNVWLGMLLRRGRLSAWAAMLQRGRAFRLASARWKRLRQIVFARDSFTCVYCGATGVALHCDHRLPASRGGTDDLTNLATACGPCNLSKHDKTPEEWRGGVN